MPKQHLEEVRRSVTLAPSALPCADLRDHPLRLQCYAAEHLDRLVQSISHQGLLYPLLVHQEGDQLRILSGHYRIRAVRQLRHKEVPCAVFTGAAEEALQIYCSANTLTRVPSAIEEAYMIEQMIQTHRLRQADVARIMQRSPAWISRRLQLLRQINPEIQNLVHNGQLRPRVAQELARLPRGNEQQRVLTIIRQRGMSKHQASEFVDWWLQASEAEKQAAEATSESESPTAGQWATRSMHKCTLLLDELLFKLSDQEWSEWWPWSEWKLLRTTLRALERKVGKEGIGRA